MATRQQALDLIDGQRDVLAHHPRCGEPGRRDFTCRACKVDHSLAVVVGYLWDSYPVADARRVAKYAADYELPYEMGRAVLAALDSIDGEV